MPDPRVLYILDRFRSAETGAPDGSTARLCEVSAEILGVSGAGVMLMSGDVPRGSLCSSDEVSALIEDLQYTLGEGPCVDAYERDEPVSEPDLGSELGGGRWASFSRPVVEAGALAVFGFPLSVGTVRLGALNLYCDRRGPLSDRQHGDALILAGVAARSVLAFQAQAAPGAISIEIESGADLRFVVHQASGMVSAQLGVSVGEALIRLRAHAFAAAKPLEDVAADVVARRLRFR